ARARPRQSQRGRTPAGERGNATTGPALASAWTAKTAASAANGVARRTRTRALEADCGPEPGNTPKASPPLAGWKVRRAQSLVAHLAPSAALSASRARSREARAGSCLKLAAALR